MKKTFSLILLLLGSMCVFYAIGVRDTHHGEMTQRRENPISETPNTDRLEKICIKNPMVEFFMYHYIRDYDIHDNQTTKNLSVPPKIFEEHMKKIQSLVNDKKITLMGGEDFLDSLKSGCFPGKNIWIFTADDGWIDMRDALVPIATKYKVPFFLGIITDRLDKKGFLSVSDVETLSKNPLVTISSHSVSHTDNSKLSEEEEAHEMCDSRNTLEGIARQKIETYIYPSGKVNPEIDEITAKKCGYMLAWSTSFGSDYNGHTGSLYDLNRIRITSSADSRFFDTILERKPTK